MGRRWCPWRPRPVNDERNSGWYCPWPHPVENEIVAEEVKRASAGYADAARWLLGYAVSLIDAGIPLFGTIAFWFTRDAFYKRVRRFRRRAYRTMLALLAVNASERAEKGFSADFRGAHRRESAVGTVAT
ncbi:hypothetical protein SAMN05445504_0043 [Burkholderia sp. CF099]|nr:hypothetical protein SAMN05445504_0043 [Burkholderia sp. CF099]